MNKLNVTRRVLITGVGGPAGYGLLNLLAAPEITLHGADMDPLASGLFNLPPAQAHVIPAACDPNFVPQILALCLAEQIEVLLPTVDAELHHLAVRVAEFQAHGITVAVPPAYVLTQVLDKQELIRACQDVVRVPVSQVLTSAMLSDELVLPVIAKPRRGSGSAGIHFVTESSQLQGLPTDGSYLIQEVLPGLEYSIDVCVRRDGKVVVAVPRSRDRLDSGVAIAGRTVLAPELVEFAEKVVKRTQLTGLLNVQVKLATDGSPALLEINPRPSGSLVLSDAATDGKMTKAWLADLLGKPVPNKLPYQELAMVRQLSTVFYQPTECVKAAI